MITVLERPVPKARKLAKLGRPRKGARPSGLSVVGKKEETRDEIMATVLRQPHRCGDDSPKRHSAVGRLLVDGHIRHGGVHVGCLGRAAELYAKAYADLRWILDSRRPYWNASAYGRREPTEDDRRAIEREWGEVSRVVRDCGPRVSKALELAILDNPREDWEAPFWILHSLGIGLAALARHYGLDK